MEETPLEKLQKRLYKPEEKFKGRFNEPELSEDKKDISVWKTNAADLEKPKSFFSFFHLILIFSLILIFGLAGVFFFSFLKPPKVFLQKIILRPNFPQEASIGDLIRFEINVKNENKMGLAMADLIFKYPQDSEPLKKEFHKILSERRQLYGLKAGEEIKEVFEFYVFGIVGEEKDIKAVLEFRIEGSNAILVKETGGRIKLSGSPVSINIEGPAEINSGQEFELKINYLSNSKEVLKDLILETAYPSGFKFKEALPVPEESRNEWRIGDLAPGDKKTIILKGNLDGTDFEKNLFKVRIGRGGKEFVLFSEENKTIITRKPILELSLIHPAVVSAGETVNGEVQFGNNLSVGIPNINIELFLSGKSIDERTISSSQGYYLGIDKKLVWRPLSYSKLKFLAPGEKGKVDFQFKILNNLPVFSSRDKNFTAKLKARIFSDDKPLEYKEVDLSSELFSELKIASPFRFNAKGFYYHQELKNSGPIPPRNGKKTTYTIDLYFESVSDDISDIKFISSLPPYVEWENKVLSAEADIKFDSITSEITAKIPRLLAQTGALKPAFKISFQVGLTPSAPQIGFSPIIMNESSVSGFNEFTRQEIVKKSPAITTELKEDEKLGFDDFKVRP